MTIRQVPAEGKSAPGSAACALGEFRPEDKVRTWRGAAWCALFCALYCAGLLGCSGKPADVKIPQEEVDRKNPVEASPASIAEGTRLYGATDCALCHGKEGDGKGVEAKDINMNTHDWRKPESLAHFTDGELSYLILKGKGRMPAYDGRETPEQVWQLVNYIRSMSASGGAAKP